MAARVMWNTRADKENWNFEKLKPIASHKNPKINTGTKHNSEKTLETTFDGSFSGSLNKCLISGNLE